MQADIISVDLDWKEKAFNRVGLAHLDASSKVVITDWDTISEDAFLERIVELAAPNALVLLDIPIDGCEHLNRSNPFRPLDRVMLRTGIPLLPSYKSKNKGRFLKESLLSLRPDLEIVESYPYAVLRILWAMSPYNPTSAWRCLKEPIGAVIESSIWWTDGWPPKYKRARPLTRRRRAMDQVYTLLKESNLPFESFLTAPEVKMGGRELARLSDTYDAILGLIAGLNWRVGSPWAFEACVEGYEGSIVLLADGWFRKRFEEVVAKVLQGN